jgi:hypothetical protein
LAYTIAQGDVVDLAGKTRPSPGAAQQLRDCLQAGVYAGQFVSGGREANLDQRVISAPDPSRDFTGSA